MVSRKFISTPRRAGRAGSLTLFALLAGVVMPAEAQRNDGSAYTGRSSNQSPAENLGRFLTMLADNPNNVEALIGAGRTALELGDADAALGLFVRANDLSQRNGRVKAGLGGALVRLERPLEAMQQFREAERLGVPLSSYAGDRGLAYDLLGQPRLAQDDYRLAMSRGPTSELRKRLAISLAISGDQAGALEVLDPLLRDQDMTAWRTRAFVIGLTGDVRDAVEAAAIALPRRELEILTPYLGRLPELSDAGKAQASHFGSFPVSGDGPRYALSDFPELAAAGTPGANLVPQGDALGPVTEAAARRETRRERRRRERREAAARRAAARESQARRRPGRSDPVQVAQAEVPSPPPPPPPPPPVAAEQIGPSLPATSPQPGFTTTQAPSETGPANTAATAERLTVVPSRFSLADLAADLQSRAARERQADSGSAPGSAPGFASGPAPESLLPAALAAISPPPSSPPPPPPPPPVPSQDAEVEEPAAVPTEPARHWVQLATGPTQDGMRFTYRRFARANAIFADQEGWYAPSGQTNRLLVGPFDNGAEAQQFLNTLAAAGIQALRWRSSQGQPITRLYREDGSPQPTAEAMAGGSTTAPQTAPSHPARHWAQVAIGREQSALRFTYRQFSRRAPQAFEGNTGWFTALNATNRLLVGPFNSRADAQAFLNAISEEGEIDGYTFRSAEGQAIERLNPR